MNPGGIDLEAWILNVAKMWMNKFIEIEKYQI